MNDRVAKQPLLARLWLLVCGEPPMGRGTARQLVPGKARGPSAILMDVGVLSPCNCSDFVRSPRPVVPLIGALSFEQGANPRVLRTFVSSTLNSYEPFHVVYGTATIRLGLLPTFSIIVPHSIPPLWARPGRLFRRTSGLLRGELPMDSGDLELGFKAAHLGM